MYPYWIGLGAKFLQNASEQLLSYAPDGDRIQELGANESEAAELSQGEQRQSCVDHLVLYAKQHVVASVILFDIVTGINGFHRSEMINLDWTELTLCFGGSSDSLNKGKRRYNGPIVAEKAYHFHTTYGPFCCRGATPFRACSIVEFVRDIFLPNLRNWCDNGGVQGTCAMCMYVSMSVFLNPLYWSQLDAERAPKDLLRCKLTCSLVALGSTW